MPHLVDSIDIILVYAIRIRFGIFREIEMSEEEEISTGVKAGAAESAAKDNKERPDLRKSNPRRPMKIRKSLIPKRLSRTETKLKAGLTVTEKFFIVLLWCG